MQLQQLAFEMSVRGIRMDLGRQTEHVASLKEKVEEVHADFMKSAKSASTQPKEFWDFKPGHWWLNKQKGGPKQLFYDTLNVECKHFSEQTGQPSLSKNALRDLIAAQREPVSGLAQHVFMFNQWDKLRSMVEGLSPIGEIMHAMWSAGLKVTRRWGSSPNMQNIPYDIEESGEIVRPGHRDLFIARPGNWLVAADYSQLELRILALLTGDEVLLKAYASGKDVHEVNARDLFNIEKFTKKQRRLAKEFVYGCNYGGSTRTVFLNLVPSFPKLKMELIDYMREKWFEIHHWIVEWQAKQFRDARRVGYTEGILSGHRFYHYWGKVKPTICYNFPIQEEAGRIMNKAMIAVRKRLRKDEFILLNVHDELVVEGPDAHRLMAVLQEEMTMNVEVNGNVMNYPVDPVYGQDWANMKAAA